MAVRQSLIQALDVLNCVILKRLDANRFTVLHGIDDWLLLLLPEAEDQSIFEYQQSSVYLSDFLVEAEEFWQSNSVGQIDSGIWTEQTALRTLHFEAVAAISNNEKFLFIKNVEYEFENKQHTLQLAREVVLSNDKIRTEHEYLHQRLDMLVQQAKTRSDTQYPVQQAIESAEFGVVILDNDLTPVTENPASRALFELSPTSNGRINPADIVLELFKSQYPEYERVFATNSRWHGELFWHQPPSLNKWLQVAIYPLIDSNQVKHWLINISDITRIKFLQQSNEKLTMYDNVTNLPNRSSFLQKLENQVNLQTDFSLLCLDIKQFKRVNELYGHRVGDELLLKLVERLKALLHPSDLLARIGGDQFAILNHSDKSKVQLETYAKRLISACDEPFYSSDNDRCNIGLNIGIASFPRDADNTEELMKFADLSVYEAKKKSKSSVKFYSLELKEASRKRLELENALREAIELEQFELFLQPILNLATGEIIKAEALIRWRLPNGNYVNPEDFIPVAEQSGLIVPIGKWVITRACQLISLLNQHKPGLKLSINLSPGQVNDQQLFDFIRTSVDRYMVNPGQLELELTEGVLVDNYDRVQLLLNSIRRLGMSVAIDDFGTGYSSLSYLKKLPIDHLKIDRSFVQDLDKSENDRAIILAVIAMAKSLNLGVIAEGVETQQQCAFLTENSCESAQGYLFSKPVPLDQFCSTLLAQ